MVQVIEPSSGKAEPDDEPIIATAPNQLSRKATGRTAEPGGTVRTLHSMGKLGAAALFDFPQDRPHFWFLCGSRRTTATVLIVEFIGFCGPRRMVANSCE
jgi:hypothetical protein